MTRTGKVLSTKAPNESQTLSDEDVHEIAIEAYVYAFPLLLMETTRRASTNIAAPAQGKAPINRFGHLRRFPDPRFNDVPSPNFDTLCSALWFDVSAEPVVIQKPDFVGRYHVLTILDMWSDVFASFGSRTTGNGAETFAIVGPRWRGSLPAGIRCLVCPTEQGWLIGRVQTDGAGDYAVVQEFQDQLSSCPLSLFGAPCKLGPNHVDGDIPTTPPLEQITSMDAGSFFSLFARLSRPNSPHSQDQPILARMQRIGLEPGKALGLAELTPSVREALDAAPAAALERLKIDMFRTGRVANGWRVIGQPVGTYGTDYLHRASVAYHALGASLAEDDCWATLATDEHTQPLDSESGYVLHFEKTQLPPVRAFWSLTLYNEHQYCPENSIDRYAIGDRDDLAFNQDGSLDLWIRRTDPGDGRSGNWLPAPPHGPFSLTMRLYWPKREALNGVWEPPAITVAR